MRKVRYIVSFMLMLSLTVGVSMTTTGCGSMDVKSFFGVEDYPTPKSVDQGLAVAYGALTYSNKVYADLADEGVLELKEAEDISRDLDRARSYLDEATEVLHCINDVETAQDLLEVASNLLEDIRGRLRAAEVAGG